MATDRYAAFLSYAHQYGEWVEVLQKNLERCLEDLGPEPHEIFLDQVDLGSGRSWVGQLQQGLRKSEQLILIATPEALASPRVEDEWDAFIADRRDWARGHVHVVMLVDVPLPPFLNRIQRVDFRSHDEKKYRQGLRELLGGLLGKEGKRDLPELPSGIEVSRPPLVGLDPKLRGRLVSWLTPVLESRVNRRAVATALGFERTALDSHPGWDCAASAALVQATGDDDAVEAALRVVGVLAEELGEDEPDQVAKLEPLRRALEKHKAEGPERGLLRTWLDCVASDHNRLVPYFQQQAELDLLDRIYVRLELRPESRPAKEPKEGELRLGRPLGIREILDLSPREHPWVTRRWVVLGDPGAGKTTLVRHLAASLAGEESPRWVPVLEALPRLMRQREWLLDRFERRVERAGYPARGLAAVLDQAGRDGRLLVLLDGLDEVPREDRDDAERLLRDLSARWPETPLVVTSRPIGYQRPDGTFTEVELLPLERDRRREFLARWFGRKGGEDDWHRADRALEVLAGDRSLEELAGNPLYLTLMALLLEQGTSPERNRTRLYDQIFDLLLEGKHKPEPQPIDAKDAVRRILRHLAYEMTGDNLDAEPRGALEDRLYRPEADALRAPLERVGRWRPTLRTFLADLSEKTGILGPHDGPDADWRFWHRTFREALAAEQLEEQWREGGDAALVAHANAIEGDLSRWAEPYALLAGRVEDPDSLVKALVGANRQLGLRALATAHGLRVETVAEILELSEDWEVRCRAYQWVPELVGDGERSLQLLERLRQNTRNGNDLFFLDLAVKEVSKRWPDHALAADKLRGRLFDHIPAPEDEDLFRSILTPKDGRVNLWRMVPQGAFWMGRAEVEEGFEFEVPQHQVAFTEGLRIGAVPVTNRQFRAFDPGHRWEDWEDVFEDELAHHPVVNVTWYQAVSFCRWLSATFPKTRGARLPTEAEWEYACRAGTETVYWSGDEEVDLARVGWYRGNSGGRTHRAGEKPANPWGLYDMHGNVWEWTLDDWDSECYQKREMGISWSPSSVDSDEYADISGADRPVRGGSFEVVARRARAAYRFSRYPSNMRQTQGFRVVLLDRT